ncbi:hypothetical protein NX722_24420 [Endozoicomonas gorgoniicola]|uniref:Uncharacterized protein n=1 Tax=Endozoicomonas gorgoniicola TaxID=1234144 RepID=A0ABT3N254_9GAMM|nr:hypothetical protein [Endozoicomonas gorgoniicola]MCW7555715.1 hypothetical protein [Endozoicomonas gorgoniicola]
MSLPAVSVADVFSCPSTAKIVMTKDSSRPEDRQWEARLEDLPEGMPTLFKGARFTSAGGVGIPAGRDGTVDIHDSYMPFEIDFSGERDGIADIQNSDMPVELHFSEASYINRSTFRSTFEYKCWYGSKRHKYLRVALNLSENHLPDSNNMPLLLEPYGTSWITSDKEGQIKRCTESAEKCSFHLPRVGVRSKTEVPDLPIENYKRLVFRVIFFLKTDNQSSLEKRLSLNALNSTEHQFLGALEGEAIKGTKVTLVDQDLFVDINEHAKAREGQEDKESCNTDAKSMVKCSCSSENLISTFNSGGHVMLDLFAAYDDKGAATKANCSLFYVPALTGKHEPHDHHHDEH